MGGWWESFWDGEEGVVVVVETRFGRGHIVILFMFGIASEFPAMSKHLPVCFFKKVTNFLRQGNV